MRLITIRVPEGDSRKVAELAFSTNIEEVAITTATVVSNDNTTKTQDVVDIQTATPLAKKFIEALMTSSFYNPVTYSLTIRHPQSLFANKAPVKEVQPIVIPTPDVFEDLWQFSKITISLIARVFLSALLLSYGMVKNQLPLMIAGLLFLPFHHQLLSIGLGSFIKEWRLVKYASVALLVSTFTIFLSGICVASVTDGPIEYDNFGTPLTGFIFAAVIGIAAAFGTMDDAGRKELIGLAATAHITIYPAWFGLKAVYGFAGESKAIEHLISFLLNITTLTFAAGLTFSLMGMKGRGIRKFIKAVRTQSKS